MDAISLTSGLLNRMTNYCRRTRSKYLRTRFVRWASERPIVSFTFDDFPKSAYRVGGMILRKYGVKGTFYASFGLIDKQTPVGEIFSIEDIRQLLKDGHELGCHTYSHLSAGEADPATFNEAIVMNRDFLARHVPNMTMDTFSYPKSQPSPRIKAIAAKYYRGCRGGGQSNNRSIVDLNLIKSCFIDYKNNTNVAPLLDLLDKNSKDKGWLVFSTHDVGIDISRFGCPSDILQELVAKAQERGSKILTIKEVCSLI